jgi:hypothetical protein
MRGQGAFKDSWFKGTLCSFINNSYSTPLIISNICIIIMRSRKKATW